MEPLLQLTTRILQAQIIITKDSTDTQFPLGETIVTWTATDTDLNTDELKQKIIIQDTTAPVITKPLDLEIEADATKTRVAVPLPQVDDIFLDGIFTNNNNWESKDGDIWLFSLGEDTITWKARDTSGNEATPVTQKIVIVGYH